MRKKQQKNRQVFRRVLGHEALESRALLTGSPWQNPMACNDLNDDGSVSASDALVAINAINSGNMGQLTGHMTAPTVSGSSSSFVDANGDGQLTAADPLMVINAINSHALPSGDGGDGAGDDATPVDQPGTTASAQAIALDDHGFGRARGAIHSADDVGAFQVAATAGQLNVALFSPVAGVTVSIQDASGQEVDSVTTTGAKSHQPAATTVTVPADGAYYLVVSGASGTTGPYCLQVINADDIPAPPPHGDGPGGSGSDDPGDDDHGGPGSQQPPPTPAALFTKLDTNTDGSLSLTEIEALPPPKDATQTPDAVFTKLDTDTSGTLSLDEFAALFARPDGGDDHGQPPHGGPGGGGQGNSGNGGGGNIGGPGGGDSGGFGPMAPPTPEQIFTKFDADSDGLLSQSEFEALSAGKGSIAQIDQVFATWDTDTSDSLSLAEFKAGLATVKKP